MIPPSSDPRDAQTGANRLDESDAEDFDPAGDRLRRVTRGRFEILGRLGRGGMAAVYAAYDHSLGRKVAIKVLTHLDPDMLVRFRREARTVAHLEHPGIVRVHTVEHHPDLHFFVMQFIEGRSLDALLAEEAPIDPMRVLGWFQALEKALSYSHARGIVHRDVKPANILVRLDDAPVLTDFGIAHVLQSTRHTATGLVMGTAEYMSPEQWKGVRVSAASDQYSLGIVLFEALMGHPPFRGTPSQLLRAHLETPAPRLAELCHDLPPGFAESIGRMLEKEPTDRFPTVRHALDATRRHTSEPVAPPSPTELAPRDRETGVEGRGPPKRRHFVRRLALVGAALFTVMAVVILGNHPGPMIEPSGPFSAPEPQSPGASDEMSPRRGVSSPDTTAEGGEESRSEQPEAPGPDRRSVTFSDEGRLDVTDGFDLVASVALDIGSPSPATICVVPEFTTNRGETLVGQATELSPGTGGSSSPVHLAAPLDSLITSPDIPRRQLTARINLWPTACQVPRDALPSSSIRLGPICAQRFPSGTWRRCPGIDPEPRS